MQFVHINIAGLTSQCADRVGGPFTLCYKSSISFDTNTKASPARPRCNQSDIKRVKIFCGMSIAEFVKV